MKQIQRLTKEINELTLKIEQEYPELYRYLDENPEPIPSTDHSDINTQTFSEYLESLKQILNAHIKSHKTL